ncbi:MAG: hypothetical protein ETSY1_42425 [Candidatus Entotheonella factor]|uniref:Uncharacterized protein n=1 Tax=Entotheonella factor TaxID=1429438 RepID=W4L4W7_ENTF1|nr:MAG: hypothetical protein ETSY1_42425 [Candidatus Entotheonella factor]
MPGFDALVNSISRGAVDRLGGEGSEAVTRLVMIYEEAIVDNQTIQDQLRQIMEPAVQVELDNLPAPPLNRELRSLISA